MLKLHKSLVHSHVEYCTPVWSPCYQKDKILIERVQHRFTRMIPVFSKLPLKDLNLWDFWVWKKGGTEQIWLKFSKWLKDFLQYHWNLCSSYLPPHISEVMNTSWPNIEPNWKWDGLRRHFFTERLVSKGRYTHYPVHGPCPRPVNTGVKFLTPVFTARVHGWYFWRPCDIIEAREHGPCCLKTVLWRQYDVMTLKVWRYIFCKHGNH